MLSVPVITLLTLLTLIFLSFEIQNTILFLSFSRTHFLYLWKKIGKFINSFFFFGRGEGAGGGGVIFFIFEGWFFSLSGCSILLGCQSSQILFTEFTLKFILWWKKEAFSHLWIEYHLSISISSKYFPCIWKQNRKF